MFLNVLSFKNGKTIPFQTKTPYSVEKVFEGWNVVIDEVNGQCLSFRGSEIVTIASQDTTKLEKAGKQTQRPKGKKSAHISTSIVTE